MFQKSIQIMCQSSPSSCAVVPTSETTHSVERVDRCPFHFGWVSKKRCRWPYAWEMVQKSRSSRGPRIECGFAQCLSPVELREPARPPTENRI